MASLKTPIRETDLYPPIKAYLESRGYAVKGDVADCDVVAMRDGDPEPVVVELKVQLSLDLLLQAVGRQRLSETVYIAFPNRASGRAVGAWKTRRKEVLRLCRMLGLGLLTVDLGSEKAPPRVEAHLDPGPYKPSQNTRRKKRLLAEFVSRSGDPMEGGGPGRKMLTAYRQDALRCARFLAKEGSTSPAKIRDGAGVDRAATILQRDVYGWFERVERGIYAITPAGIEALDVWAGQLDALEG